MVTPLERKLLRDLGRLKGQVLTLALVVAGGVSSFVGLRSTFRSLAASKDAYYERTRMGDVFAHLQRAPLALAAHLESLPGVALAYPRLVEEVRLPLQDEPLPAAGRLLSIPDRGSPPLCGLHLRAGRLPDPHAADEVLVNETYATARAVKPGDGMQVVIGGRLRRLRVAGIALSPEYVYAVRPGAMTDQPGTYAILWMPYSAMAAALHHEGSFNDVVLALQPGASTRSVIGAVDRTLEGYGGIGAVDRAHQASNRILEGEFGQLAQLATMITAIFLAVAAFLVNVVLSRMVTLQRPEIAALKALGYRNREIGLHFFGVVAVTVALGAILGCALGVWYGRWMTALYGRFFHFPVLEYRLTMDVVLVAVGVSFASGAGGALLALRAAVKMAPAEAMRPPAPAVYRRSLAERLGLGRVLGPGPMMVVRELERRPLRALLSALGIGAAVGICIIGRFSFDSFEVLISDLFLRQQREDVTVTLFRPAPLRAVAELRHLPGAQAAEGLRVVPARIAAGHRSRDIALVGLEPDARLRRLIDRRGGERAVPRACAGGLERCPGLILTRKLGELLEIAPGDVVDVDLREGARRVHRLEVAGLVDEPFGLTAYLDIASVWRLLDEAPMVTTVQLLVDPAQRPAFFAAAQRSPLVASVDDKQATIAGLRAQTGESTGVITAVVTALAIAIAVGVVYNNARVALSQRSRDLATLRVLGFDRREISAVLLGELGVQILIGLPLGMLLGRWWAGAVAASIDQETLRFPLYIAPTTYALAAAVAVAAGLASALAVRRRLDHLDLPAVLKTRE